MVKSGGLVPGQTTPQLLRNLQEQQPKTLDEKEQTSKSQKGQKSDKLSAADHARIVSQAGFQRQKVARKGFDAGDGSGQQYALPQDDVDNEVWSQERLESAQGSLSMAASQFGNVAGSGEAQASLGASVVGSSFMPSEEDLEEMEDIAKRKPPQPMPLLDEVSNSVSALFGIELSDEVPVGHKILAAGLVVAGEQEAVQVDKGKLKEQHLAGGLQKVTKRGNQAVGEAQRLNKGINEQLNVQRTFVFKR